MFSSSSSLDNMQNYLDLSDKVALITGASSGIGAATAEVFARLRAKVAIGYHTNAIGAGETRDNIVQAAGTAVCIQADVRSAKEIERMVKQTTDQLGSIDILVN